MDNLLQFPHVSESTIIFFQPTALAEAEDAIAALKSGQLLLTNVTGLHPDEVQRMTDYLQGSTHALSGEHAEIGNGVYLFAPPSMNLTHSRSTVQGDEWQAQSA